MLYWARPFALDVCLVSSKILSLQLASLRSYCFSNGSYVSCFIPFEFVKLKKILGGLFAWLTRSLASAGQGLRILFHKTKITCSLGNNIFESCSDGLIVLKEGKALAQVLPLVMSCLAYSCRCDSHILRLASIITYLGSHSSLGLVSGSFLHPNDLATSSCDFFKKKKKKG